MITESAFSSIYKMFKKQPVKKNNTKTPNHPHSVFI